MRTLLSLAFLLTGAGSASAATPWEMYLAHPTPDNARKVARIEYSSGREPQGGYDADDIQLLEDQVLAGDGSAFQLAFRLYKQSDGGLAEDLGIAIGRAVRVKPRFFLTQVEATGKPCREFSWILRAPGLEYSDRPVAVKYEMQKRRAALESVTEAGLARVRRACLAIINEPPN